MDSLHGRRISQQVSKPQSTSFTEALTNEALNRKVRKACAKLTKQAVTDLSLSATSANTRRPLRLKAFRMLDVIAVMAVYPRPSLPCRFGQQ